jgi:hypothetical protein
MVPTSTACRTVQDAPICGTYLIWWADAYLHKPII